MEEANRFMEWAMNTLQHEQPALVVDDMAPSHVRDMGAPAANSWVPGGTTDGNVGHIPAAAAMDCDVLRLPPLLPSSVGNASSSSISGNAAASWKFSATTSELAYRSQPTRGGGFRCPRPTPMAPYATEHIMAERKRREKINQRFAELSAVIPGLTKMDKATILSDATRYVRELQENVKAQEEAAGSDLNTVVLINKPCHATPVARKPLPDVEVHFSGTSVMVRIHCENAKGVIVKVLTEVEELHLGIIDASVMAFSASTLIITITAKVSEGFTTVTAEELIGRLNSVLSESTIA